MRTLSTASAQLGLTNYKTEITVREQLLLADEPVSAGGQGAGPAPYDYLLASLAACTLMTLRMYADLKGWNLGELDVQMSLSKDADKHTHIHRQLSATETLTDEQWDKLLAIAAKTPVTLTLMAGSSITTERLN